MMNKPKKAPYIRVESFSMALAEAIPDPALLCVPADEIAAALEIFLANEDGALDEVPQTLDRYLTSRRTLTSL